MTRPYLLIGALTMLVGFFACKATGPRLDFDDDDEGSTTSTPSGNGGAGAANLTATIGSTGGSFSGAGGGCGYQCSADLHAVVDCNGNILEECTGDQGCDIDTATCINACDAAINNKQSVGCEYFSTDMDSYSGGHCFAAFVANTWNTPAKIAVELGGAEARTTRALLCAFFSIFAQPA